MLSSQANEINIHFIRRLFFTTHRCLLLAVFSIWDTLLYMGHLRFRVHYYYRVEDNIMKNYRLPISKIHISVKQLKHFIK